jgi:hypothetical protein
LRIRWARLKREALGGRNNSNCNLKQASGVGYLLLITLKNRASLTPILIILALLILVCSGLCVLGFRYLDSISYHPTPQERFARYLTDSGNTKLLQNAANIQAEELSMGQGVYLRFEADSENVLEFLEDNRTNPNSYHYPYESVSCQQFHEAYPDWADEWTGYEWWRPREVTAPECYVTRGCEYLLFDKESETVYYYFFPDFLGKDYLCVENKSKN